MIDFHNSLKEIASDRDRLARDLASQTNALESRLRAAKLVIVALSLIIILMIAV